MKQKSPEKSSFDPLTPIGSPSSPRNQALLPHTLPCGLSSSHFLHNLFSVSALTPITSFRWTQDIFRAKSFHLQYPTLSTTGTLHTYSPMQMEQTDFRTLAFKLQMPWNNPEHKHMTDFIYYMAEA
jgi:hypothetical protein